MTRRSIGPQHLIDMKAAEKEQLVNLGDRMARPQILLLRNPVLLGG